MCSGDASFDNPEHWLARREVWLGDHGLWFDSKLTCHGYILRSPHSCPRWLVILRNDHYYQIGFCLFVLWHYSDVIMGAMASQITSLAIVYVTVYSRVDKKKKRSASLSLVQGIHRNSPHKWPVTRKIFPFDDVIMDDHAILIGSILQWRHISPITGMDSLFPYIMWQMILEKKP